MAFIEKEDLYSAIREYNLDAITDGDEDLIDLAIDAGVQEVSDIFTPNEMKVWQDGRPIYDVTAMFAATGSSRHSLLLKLTITVVMWQLIGLCNTGVEYGVAESRYDRAIETLEKLASGKRNSATLPKKAPTPPPDDELPYGFGSMPKFNHE